MKPWQMTLVSLLTKTAGLWPAEKARPNVVRRFKARLAAHKPRVIHYNVIGLAKEHVPSAILCPRVLQLVLHELIQ